MNTLPLFTADISLNKQKMNDYRGIFKQIEISPSIIPNYFCDGEWCVCCGNFDCNKMYSGPCCYNVGFCTSDGCCYCPSYCAGQG